MRFESRDRCLLVVSSRGETERLRIFVLLSFFFFSFFLLGHEGGFFFLFLFFCSALLSHTHSLNIRHLFFSRTTSIFIFSLFLSFFEKKSVHIYKFFFFRQPLFIHFFLGLFVLTCNKKKNVGIHM
jgi:hypothetical protein